MNAQFKKGVLELIVLESVRKRDMYGYELVAEVSKVVDVNEGTIYPLLKRLTNEHYFETYLRESSEGPPRKYYHLTAAGVLYRDALEADYQALLQAVCAHRSTLKSQSEDRYRDMLDYYTLWAHQIKTPIAAAELLVQSAGAESGPLAAELLKIEQYVEMVLSYLRLGSQTTDYVLRRCALDDIIRGAVRKFARLFILKHISLDFQETGRTVLTDAKWLSFVLEQLLSNALKYTPEGGSIRIYGDGTTLVVMDTGIGIRAEDLPRVFEKGFTGLNGRSDRKSTGIGLYLCRQVMDRLGHSISLSSRPGRGTLVRLDLENAPQVVE